MTRRTGLWTLVLLTAAGTAAAQTQGPPWRGPAPQPSPPVGPNQPVVPQHPTLQQRPPAQLRLPEGFPLTLEQEAYLDRVLQAWEQHSKKVKTFAATFTRWEYDPVFGPPDTFKYMDEGEVKYAAPDKGMFRVLYTDKNGKMVRIEPERAEHWVCDGKSVYQFNHPKKQLIQHKLPPEMQGKAIAEGPLPFLFGAEAEKLKQRYFLRVITPREVQNEQVWLEAHPRFQTDAANLRKAELILNIKDLNPQAIAVYSPNGKNHTTYKFHGIVVNENDPLKFLKGNPFTVLTPFGWKKIVEEPPAPQVSRLPPPSRR